MYSTTFFRKNIGSSHRALASDDNESSVHSIFHYITINDNRQKDCCLRISDYKWWHVLVFNVDIRWLLAACPYKQATAYNMLQKYSNKSRCPINTIQFTTRTNILNERCRKVEDFMALVPLWRINGIPSLKGKIPSFRITTIFSKQNIFVSTFRFLSIQQLRIRARPLPMANEYGVWLKLSIYFRLSNWTN